MCPGPDSASAVQWQPFYEDWRIQIQTAGSATAHWTVEMAIWFSSIQKAIYYVGFRNAFWHTQIRRVFVCMQILLFLYLILIYVLLHTTHGIMGTPIPNKFSYLRPRPDGKYTTYDLARMANSLVIGQLRSHETNRRRVSDNNNISQLLRDSFSVSQQPPSGNLLPIFPWIDMRQQGHIKYLFQEFWYFAITFLWFCDRFLACFKG